MIKKSFFDMTIILSNKMHVEDCNFLLYMSTYPTRCLVVTLHFYLVSKVKVVVFILFSLLDKKQRNYLLFYFVSQQYCVRKAIYLVQC